MIIAASAIRKSPRLEALIRQCVGWQVDDLQVLVGDGGVILEGHAYSALARVLAEVEAARLSGMPVEANRIEVN
jgi:hypothetical protein